MLFGRKYYTQDKFNDFNELDCDMQYVHHGVNWPRIPFSRTPQRPIITITKSERVKETGV